jgi:predicted NACHT family NTPase
MYFFSTENLIKFPFFIVILKNVTNSRRKRLRQLGKNGHLLIETIQTKYPIFKMLLLANESYLVIASVNPIITIWNFKTKNQIRKLLIGHTNQVRDLVHVQDQEILASGSLDMTIKMWNSTSGALLKNLTGHLNSVLSLALLKNARLASSSTDRTILIWNLTGGQVLKRLLGHTYVVRCIYVLPNDGLASGSHDWSIRLWNVTTGRIIKTISRQTFLIECLVALDDGRLYLASGEHDFFIKIWNITSGSLLNLLGGHKSTICSLINLKRDHLASASSDKTVKIWNYVKAELLQTLDGHSNSVFDLALLANGHILSGSFDASVKIWNFPINSFAYAINYGKRFFLI